MSLASVASYTWGQCTAFVASVLDWVPGGLGNAGDWARNAAAEGYPVGHTPAAGDVAVWAPGYAGAHSVGHVAEVTGVDPRTGAVSIAEENWTYGAGRTDTRTIDAGTAAGLSYIGPKDGTPSSALKLTQGFDLGGTAKATAGDLPIVGPVISAALGPGAAAVAAASDPAGTAAGAVGGAWTALQGGIDTTVTPWFQRNAVALVVGVIIWTILVSGGSGSPSGGGMRDLAPLAA